MTAIDCTPTDLPHEFVGLDRRGAGGLPVGAPGKVGVLELALARRGGTTRVVHQHQRAPLHVYRPIHLDANLPEMAFVFVQQFGDGFVDGDRCRIAIDCAPGILLPNPPPVTRPATPTVVQPPPCT